MVLYDHAVFNVLVFVPIEPIFTSELIVIGTTFEILLMFTVFNIFAASTTTSPTGFNNMSESDTTFLTLKFSFGSIITLEVIPTSFAAELYLYLALCHYLGQRLQ